MRSLSPMTPLRRTAAALALAGICLAVPQAAHASDGPGPPGLDLDRSTVLDMQRAMDGGRVTSADLTRAYLRRIERLNPRLGAVIGVNPDAMALARRSD
ncbi:hypothetical protein ACFQ08_41545, partial [Streptosporangium algeriense]